jgi:amphi-Trp domain-containing protein
MERFEALHAAAPTPAEVVVYRNDGISEFEPKACGMLEGWTTVADMSIGNLPPSKEGLPRSFPMQEGQIKIKTTIGLTELVQRLEELVAALKNGRIVIESRNRMIMMKPDDPVKIKIAADVQNGKKNRQEQMTIKLEWLRIAAGDRNVNDYGAYRL